MPQRRTTRTPTHLIDETEVLTPRDQARLFQAVRRGREATAELDTVTDPVRRRGLEAEVRLGGRAFQRLVSANLRLVFAWLDRHPVRSRDLRYEDLIQEGVRGLIRAVEKFDPSVGTQFSTYAWWWIRQTVDRAVKNSGLVRIPVHVFEGRASEDARIAMRRFTDLESIEHLLDVWADHEESVMHDFDCDVLGDVGFGEPVVGVDTDEQVEAALLVEQALVGLTEREATVLRRRAGFSGAPETLEEIGWDLGLTRERIRQIEAKALEKSRRRLALAA